MTSDLVPRVGDRKVLGLHRLKYHKCVVFDQRLINISISIMFGKIICHMYVQPKCLYWRQTLDFFPKMLINLVIF